MVSFTCMAGKNGKHCCALSQCHPELCPAQMSLEATCPYPHISPQIPGFASLSGSKQFLWFWSFDLRVELLCYGNIDNNPQYKRRWWQGKVNMDTGNTEGIIQSICGFLLLLHFPLIPWIFKGCHRWRAWEIGRVCRAGSGAGLMMD